MSQIKTDDYKFIFIYKGLYKYGKIIYPYNHNGYELRDHNSFVISGQNVIDGKELDKLGTNPTLKPSSNGILGPVKISQYIKLPGGAPIDSMHALDLGLFKNLNELFFNSDNKKEPFYLGIDH